VENPFPYQPLAHQLIRQSGAPINQVFFKKELEALEACYWLKATGFAHYVKSYEDKKFPIALDMARKANSMLDEDSLVSLIKRLETLNECAQLLKNKNNDGSASINNYHQRKKNLTFHNPLTQSLEEENSNTSGTFPVLQTTIQNHETEELQDEFTDTDIEHDIHEALNGYLLNNTQVEEHKHLYRQSVYDNVPSDKTVADNMINKNTNDDKFSFEENIYELTLQEVNKQVQCSMDDEDDDTCSISSQEEDDEDLDEVESLHSMHHLHIPGAHAAHTNMIHVKFPGMGSVDSGVPSSPVMRSPSVRRRRVRWHSFQKSCERESMLVNKIMALSAGQLNVLKKISLLRLTALLERYSCQNRTGWQWTVPKLLKKLKTPDYRDKNIFGVPLLVNAERTGSPLPHTILLVINYLSRQAVDNIGIFRKSGMKTRIDKLRTVMENNPDKVDFDGYSVFDVADTLKQYFRELPEPLLTQKLAETFISIHKDVPKELRLQAMQLAITLMPDENRDVLQTLLLFLNEVASHAYVNQMSEKNLATCFVPAFFHLCGGGSNKNERIPINSAPKKLKRSLSQQYQKELDDTMAAQECLAEMMKCVRFLFCVPEDVMMKSQFSYIEQGDPVPLEELGQNVVDPGVDDGYHSYIDNCFAGLLQETTVNSRSSKKWVVHSEVKDMTLSYRKMNDGYPLRLWRAVTSVHASPEEILKRLVHERHLWDDSIVQWEVLETLDETSDVFYYETQSVAPSVKRDFVILRSWRKNLTGGSCGVVMTSIQHRSAPPSSGVRGTLLACHCLIEPIGLGSSKLTYIARIDLRGRGSRYYNKAIAPRNISANVVKLRDSFNCGPDGPETNV